MNSLLTSREAEDIAGVGSLFDVLKRMVTPPAAVRNIISREAAKLYGKARVTINTPLGPITINPSDPADRAKLAALLKGIKINIGGQPDNPVDQVDQAVRDTVPGGWLGIGLGVVGGILVWKLMSARGGRS